MAYNFQTGSNKTALQTEHESATEKVLFFIESILQNANKLQHARLS
jgi:hypothetical protein